MAQIILIQGPQGSGVSTVGTALALYYREQCKLRAVCFEWGIPGIADEIQAMFHATPDMVAIVERQAGTPPFSMTPCRIIEISTPAAIAELANAA